MGHSIKVLCNVKTNNETRPLQQGEEAYWLAPELTTRFERTTRACCVSGERERTLACLQTDTEVEERLVTVVVV